MKILERACTDMENIIYSDGVDCTYNDNTVKVLFLRDPEKNTDAYREGVETTSAFVYGTLSDFGNVQHGDTITVNGTSYRVSEIRKGDAHVLMYVTRA